MTDAKFLRPLAKREAKKKAIAVYDVESKSGECASCSHFHHGGPCTHTIALSRRGADDFAWQAEQIAAGKFRAVSDRGAVCACNHWVRSQTPGFSRPFLLGFLDPEGGYREFRNAAGHEERASLLPNRLGNLQLSRRPPDPVGPILLDDRSPGGFSRPWQDLHVMPGGLFDAFMRDVTGEGNPDPGAKYRYAGNRVEIYAHNGGRFDHLFVLSWVLLHHETFDFEITSASSRMQRLCVRRRDDPDAFYVFLDSISLLPMSLDEIGKKYGGGTEKLTGHDLAMHEDDPRWSQYLELDCRTLAKGLSKFRELVEKLGGELGITLPATSMKLFRKKFQGDIWIRRNPHFSDCRGTCEGPRVCGRKFTCNGQCHGCAFAFVRRGYYGGRSELFRREGRNVYYFDINSSYPHSMLEPMPVGRMVAIDGPSEEKMRAMRRTHVGFVDCDVEIPRCAIPPLPFRHGGKLKFPFGRLSGVWDYDELQLLRHPRVGGRIVRTRRTVWYEAEAIFRAFVETLYAYREKGNPLYDAELSDIAKGMLNSNYGKWGMNEVRSALVFVPRGAVPPADGQPLARFGHDPFASPIWERETVVEAPYIVPQISAHITALSRMKLFFGLMAVLELGGEPLYSDTDSVMCTFPDENVGARFPQGEKLGQWKREDPGALLDYEGVLPKLYRLAAHVPGCRDEACRGCKLHFHLPSCKDKKKCPGCSDGKFKMKGVGSKEQTAENWQKLMAGADVAGKRLSQHRTMLRTFSRSMEDAWIVPREVVGTKSLRSDYDKRIFQPDGSTEAVRIDAW